MLTHLELPPACRCKSRTTSCCLPCTFSYTDGECDKFARFVQPAMGQKLEPCVLHLTTGRSIGMRHSPLLCLVM
ncbi:hypothetical protein RU639_009321 [Aspergillus parasiticus]